MIAYPVPNAFNGFKLTFYLKKYTSDRINRSICEK